MTFTKTVHSLDELKEFWKDLLPKLQPPFVLLLSGDVGAGKTTSTQIIAELLGMKNVQSPSFAIHLRYENAQGESLDHVDLYRLKDDDDLESSGFWDLFQEPQGRLIIEWAERLNYDYLPMNWQKIDIRFSKDSITQRTLSVKEVEN
ncbi:putative ATPase/GTPase [Bdellovibrio bacteriovorus W]|nr:putative ATPase/GTPase [Bdellovibrio bacteriovorus W]